MTPPNAQPSLHELTARFLANRAASPVDSIESEVQPHEVIGGFQAPVKATWDEATAALRFLGVSPEKLACPPEWAAFVALETDLVLVPLAAGFFPQRFRKLPGQVAQAKHRSVSQVPGFSGLRGWVRKALKSGSPTQLLIAAGIAAQLGDWADAETALSEAEAVCTGDWNAALKNQRAAVAWLKGEAVVARQQWAQLDHPTSAFNRSFGMVSGHEKNDELLAATKDLPETSGWRHLASLYQLLPTG